MRQHPRTPQTLPCADEDPFFVFDEVSSIDSDSLGAEIGCSTIEEAPPMPSFFVTSCERKEDFRYTVEKQANTTIVKEENKENSVQLSTKHKRRFYRSKILSRSSLTNLVKAALPSQDKSSRYLNDKNNFKNKDRYYHSLEDDEEPTNPDDFDNRTSTISLPVTTSLPWRKKSTADSSSSISASSFSSVAKLKWNRMLQKDSLATFKSPLSSSKSTVASSTSSVTKTMTSRTVVEKELSSCSSIASSITSCNSSERRVDDGEMKRFEMQSQHLASLLPKGLYNSRVDEDEDTDDDDDEDYHHPGAGSFAFAIGRAEF